MTGLENPARECAWIPQDLGGFTLLRLLNRARKRDVAAVHDISANVRAGLRRRRQFSVTAHTDWGI